MGITMLKTLDFRRLFEAAPTRFLVLSPNLEILAASDSYLEITQTVRDEIVGRNLFDVFPDNPDDSTATGEHYLGASLNRVKQTLRPDTMAVQQYDHSDPMHKDSPWEHRWWSAVNTPVLDEGGELEYIIHQAVEVTEFVRTSEARSVTSRDSQLRAEILERSATLGASNDSLRAASDAKNRFLSRMSHELRTPFTAISGYSELLSLSDLSPEHAGWVACIRRAGAHLLDLIDEILDISRIEGGRFSISIEPISLERVLDEAIELMRPLADAEGIEILCDADARGIYVSGDGQCLKQVLINLISNAINYNRAGGTVTIGSSRSDDRVTLNVTDTGRGIAAKDLERLFEPFERLDAAATGVEGTGLGLALSRDLVEMMDGTIDVTSEPGKGSTFSVTLNSAEPIAITPIEASTSAVLETREYDRPVKLLYIEDTVANARLVGEILKRRPSIELLPAMLGRLGIDLAEKHKPDAVLLDLHLPDIDGAEVLRYFAVRPELSKIPVVVLTADATRSQYEQLKALGAREYLTKPVSVETLLSTVDAMIVSPN